MLEVVKLHVRDALYKKFMRYDKVVIMLDIHKIKSVGNTYFEVRSDRVAIATSYPHVCKCTYHYFNTAKPRHGPWNITMVYIHIVGGTHYL